MRDYYNDNRIPTLADAARTLSSCAENIQESAEHIIYSCDDIADTKRTYPVLTSAGPDERFGTADDITSR